MATVAAAAGVAVALLVAVTAQANPPATGLVAVAAPPPGTVFRDCPECPELVVIPAGRFVMGTGARRAVEGPPVEVTIPRPFALGRFEVTFDEWEACVAAGGCTATPGDHGWGRGRRPVINVTFADVGRYVAWLTARSGAPYRLPSEREWDYANRAGTTTTWWWGEEAADGQANCRGCRGAPRVAQTEAVGSYPPNPFGLYDTTGNVFEWVADCWRPDLTAAATSAATPVAAACSDRVVRGGGWYYVPGVARSAWRGPNAARANSYAIGFRVARDLTVGSP